MLKVMPLLAILRYELRSLWAGWLVRLWLIAAGLLTLLMLSANWAQMQTAPLVALLASPYLVFPWFIVVIVLGVMPVTGARAEALADGILSRPITRYEYLLASWMARVVTVVGGFLLVTLPAILLAVWAKRPAPPDEVTAYGLIASLGLVSLVLTFLVSLGFLVGTLLRGAVLAMVVLLFVWFPINMILNVFALEEFSTITLDQALPELLRRPWSASEAAERPGVSEKDLAKIAEGASFVYLLTGGTPPPPPEEKKGFYDRDEFEDFSLWRVILGYGLPTVLAIGLAAVWFSRQDL